MTLELIVTVKVLSTDATLKSWSTTVTLHVSLQIALAVEVFFGRLCRYEGTSLNAPTVGGFP